MKQRFGFLRAGWLAVAALLTMWPAQAQEALPRFESVAPGADFPIDVSGPRYERGYLFVAQQIGEPDGLVLRLPVVRIRALNPDPNLAPVLLVNGGPGIGDLSAARYPGAYPWTANRDFIVMGRRGTRYAMPSLRCPEIGRSLNADDDAEGSQLFASLDACRTELEAMGVALNAYNSDASASDIDALRRALGEDQLALFAASYGTRLALVYARDYPQQVQSMVLDSPLPHSAIFDDEYPANVEQVLRRTAALCALDPSCAAAYPELEQRFFQAIADAPRLCADDKTAPPCQYRLATAVPVSSAQDFARAPMRMEQAINGRAPSGGAGGGTDFDWGVRLSVWCSEALPFSNRARGPLENSFGGIDGAVFQPAVCDRWGVDPRPAASVEPTLNDTPTLILAGELDMLTPPRWGADAARGLSESRMIAIPGGFHGVATDWDGDGCAMSLAAAFFNSPQTLLESDTPPACILARRYPEFVLQ